MEKTLNKKTDKEQRNKTSAAKLAGLKSSFAVGEDVVMTSFGHGNEAIVEKKISQQTVIDVNTKKPAFSVKPHGENFMLHSSALAEPATSDSPMKKRGMDAIRAKDMLERKYFGKTFDDNIHIQIIYNILDILKILTVHSNNIVYELDNMFRRDEKEFDDFIGYMSSGKNYDKWCETCERAENLQNRGLLNNRNSDNQTARQLLSALNTERQFNEFIRLPQLAYFGNAMYRPTTKKDVWERKERWELYAIVGLLGMVRQICTHSHMSAFDGDSLINSDAWLYNLEQLNSIDESYIYVLNDIYITAVDTINRDFFKNNSNSNFAILQEMYPKDKKDDLVVKFYDFVVLKSFKNMGFSIKKLREAILCINNRLISNMRSTDYDSVRSKMYQLFDFALVRYFENKPDVQDETVAKLRLAQNDDEKKAAVYNDLATSVWAAIAPTVNCMVKHMNGNKIKELNAHKDVVEYRELPGMIKADNTSYFSKLIYLLSMFLDGKEINDLITTLINKFENIESFYTTLGELGLEKKFVPEYKFFENSGKVAKELREINSFCRMQKCLTSAKYSMYREAAEILGTDLSDDELDRVIDKMLCIEIVDGKSKRIKGETGLRNFIASNVIESSRFQYLIRYSNPKKVRALASNRALILFQLKRLPESQIERYYTSCFGEKLTSLDNKIESLASLIHNISFKDFENVKQGRNASLAEKNDKQKKQAIISLYLTVLYLITKNLVYVNSRYVIAFSAWQRDNQLYFHDSKDQKYFTLTKHFVDNGWLKAHPCKYLTADMDLIKNDSIRLFRNNAAHLNVVRNLDMFIGDARQIDSYYALYHYAMQRMMENKYTKDSKQKPPSEAERKWLDAVLKYGTYNKDYVKALCTPFGYNLPRFKNLSICDLFDRNEMKETKETGEIKSDAE